MSVTKKVWGLWSDLNEMAEDLTESTNILRRERDAGRLPDPRHDRRIVLRARGLGKRLSIGDLAKARASVPEDIDSRRAVIAAFYAAAGGVSAVSERSGATPNHLYAAKSKGYLPTTRRFEMMRMAEEVNFDLPATIFTPPKG